jgi:hypothetical protein
MDKWLNRQTDERKQMNRHRSYNVAKSSSFLCTKPTVSFAHIGQLTLSLDWNDTTSPIVCTQDPDPSEERFPLIILFIVVMDFSLIPSHFHIDSLTHSASSLIGTLPLVGI